MHDRWTIPLLAALCLILVACGSEDIDGSGSNADDGTPATATGPTSEPSATPLPTGSSAPSISIGNLTTLDWQLVEIDDTPLIDGSIVTMTFIPDNRSLVNGYTDCHGYMAGIEWDDTNFQLSDSGPFAGLDEQERICQHPENGPEQDAAFFAALSETASYHASNERLVLYDGDGEARLAFIPRGAVTIDPTLTDTVWVLTSLNGDSLLPETSISIAFGPEGASGTDGCNEYGSGLLFANEGRLTFAGGFKTEMACLTPEGVMEQADRYSEALFSSVAYRVEGDHLELMNHDGATTLVFARKEQGAFDANLAAHRWGLIEVNGQPAIPGSLVTLELAEGSISGSDGCNSYGGELLYANDGALEVVTESLSQTDAGCRTDDLLSQAELVTSILADAATYQIEGDRLTIGDNPGNTLVFGPQADVLLIGNTWSLPGLMTIESNGEVRWDALIEGTEITLTFNEDGTLEGSSGCNTYGGNYTLDGASITIGELFWTEMACSDPPGVMEQEMTYIDTLQAVTTWEIGMNGLTLMTDDGRDARRTERRVHRSPRVGAIAAASPCLIPVPPEQGDAAAIAPTRGVSATTARPPRSASAPSTPRHVGS